MRPVSTSDRRARDEDRDAAVALVEAAFDDGQIVQMDRDVRVTELRRAQTMAEIYMHTRDLAPQGEALEAPAPQPTVTYGPARTAGVSARRETTLPKALFLIPFAVVLVVAIAIAGSLLVFTDAVQEVEDATGVDEASAADVLSEEGYAALVSAVEAQTGSTEAFDAVLYPEYAVVSLPVDGGSKRYESFYWDGSSLAASSKGTASGPRFDLIRVAPSVLVDLVDQVQRLIEEPTSWYAIVRAPDADRAMIWAYASNEYSETAYLGARRDGTVTYDSTEH